MGTWRNTITLFLAQYRITRDDILITGIIVAVAMAAFALGRLSVLQGSENGFSIEYAPSEYSVPVTTDTASEEIVASKTGSKYHFTWCPGAQTIKESNKIYFASAAAALAAGYEPAANCPGLQ